MAELIDGRDADAILRALDEHVEGVPFAAMAVSEHLAHSYQAFGAGVLLSCPIEPGLRELAVAMTLRACGAHAMAERHIRLAARLGVDVYKLESLSAFETAEGFTGRERAVLRFAMESATKVQVGDAAFDALGTWFDTKATAALVLLVAYYAGLAHIAVPLDAQPLQEPRP